jgi:hypothetical protein
MPRCIAVMVAALAIAWCAPLAAQAPEQSRPEEGGNATPPAGQSRVGTRPAPAYVAPRPLRVPVEQIDQVTKDSIRALDLQTEFPRKIEPVRIPIPQELIWIALVVVVALILYAMRDTLLSLLRRRKEGWEPPPAFAAAAALAHGTDALAAADALSREGRFVEAMHMLLLQGLSDIREQLRETFADSLTSREILRGARLDPAGRTSLREIIAAVERTYFGGYPAQADDYALCRRNFDTLRRALQGGARA